MAIARNAAALTGRHRRCQGGARTDTLRSLVGPASAADAAPHPGHLHLGRCLPRLARRVELARGQPVAGGAAADRRAVRGLEPGDAQMVRLAITSSVTT